jgi:putative FmdB family regulatory protein
MPTYDYECDACQHKFELYQSISAAPESVCPQCKKKKLRRLIGTGGAIMFKGSGFYQTDYRSESYKKSASADKKTSEGSSTSSDSKAGSSDAKASPAKSESGGSSSSAAPKGKKTE